MKAPSSSAERLAALPPDKRAQLIEQLLNKRKERQIQPRDRQGTAFPLAPAQERLWFVHQLNPDHPLYNEPSVIDISGQLDVTALQAALDALVRRHEPLRTSFQEQRGQPVQVIAPDTALPLARIDLSGYDPAARAAELERLITRDIRQPFDLRHPPLLRATLFRLEEQAHVLLLTGHHIVFDDWSGKLLHEELPALYDALVRGKAPDLPALPVQYIDYALWQREWLQSSALDTQLAYWKQHLSGDRVQTDLPADRSRSGPHTFRGGLIQRQLPATLVRSLKALSKQEETTLFTTLLAAFTVLLHRYTGHDDIVLGTPVAGRTQREVEKLLGCFINILVIRADLSGNPTFREALNRVRTVMLAAYANQELPFERLVDALKPKRTVEHSPLFNILFSQRQALAHRAEVVGCTMQSREIHPGLAKYDLTLGVTENDETLILVAEYAADRFDAATIERLLYHFEMLLADVAARPDVQLAAATLLSAAEREQILMEWNATATDLPPAYLHELVERQAEATPDALALIFEDQQVTYGQLDRRANQIARYLNARGIGPESLVGVFLERSVELVVAILGILKAGAAYLPVDPRLPRDRIGFMLGNACADLVLTQQTLCADLPDLDLPAAAIDTLWTTIAEQPATSPTRMIDREQAAYVIYTSGSTGQPKGVVVPHRAVVANIQALIADYGLDEHHRLLQFMGLGFDVVVEEIFLALASGATLVLHPDPAALTPSQLLATCERLGVTTIHMTPAYWHQMVDMLAATNQAGPSCLKLLIVGGERPSLERLVTWTRLTSGTARFVNAYGPTEATVTSTWHAAPREVAVLATLSTLPIGRPIAKKRLYILDQWLQPVPIGVVGEIYIGGSGLACGYLGRPDLTAERFIPDPFAGQSAQAQAGARMYRTGDLARYDANGSVEFVGRTDQQVKVRGYRIELGEIEAALLQHPAVKTAVMVAEQRPDGVTRLVAYVVPVAGQTIDLAELRRSLGLVLPDYMLPAALVLLDALPLTANGKLDRRHLPKAPTIDLPDSRLSPRTAAEAVVAEVWQRALDVQQVGVDDNFFELGGHSLLIMQILFQLQELFQIELPMRAFLETPTVAGLVAALVTRERQPGQIDTIARLHQQIQHMSAADVQTLLHAKRHPGGASS